MFFHQSAWYVKFHTVIKIFSPLQNDSICWECLVWFCSLLSIILSWQHNLPERSESGDFTLSEDLGDKRSSSRAAFWSVEALESHEFWNSTIWPIYIVWATYTFLLRSQQRMTGSDGEPVEFHPNFSDLLPDLCLLRQPKELSVIDARHPAVWGYIAWAVQMSGFWLSSQTAPTLSPAIQTPGRLGSWVHSGEKKADGLKPIDGGLQRALLLR